MENAQIPPNIHFTRPNPAIPLDKWNMAVPTKLMPWPVTQNERRMSISGFGMGGTNGHVVLESYTPGRKQLSNASLLNGTTNGNLTNGIVQNTNKQNGKRVFILSSQDQAGFKRLGNALVEHLDTLGPAASTPEYLADLAYTLAVGRSGLSWKASILAGSVAELREKLLTDPGENAIRATPKQPRIG